MKHQHDSLIEKLDESIEIFARIRTPDAVYVAAFDTLKQARALIAGALHQEQLQCRRTPSPTEAAVAG